MVSKMSGACRRSILPRPSTCESPLSTDAIEDALIASSSGGGRFAGYHSLTRVHGERYGCLLCYDAALSSGRRPPGPSDRRS